MPNRRFGLANSDIRHESMEAPQESVVIDEEVGGSDPHDPPALSLEVFPTLDVDTPLTSIHPVPIALVFEGDTSGRDAEVRMKTQSTVGELD